MVDKIEVGKIYYCEWLYMNKLVKSIALVNDIDNTNIPYKIKQILLTFNNENSVGKWGKNTDNFKRLATADEVKMFYEYFKKSGRTKKIKSKELIIQLW